MRGKNDEGPTELLLPDIEDIYELSPMQISMLFQSLLQTQSGVFVEQVVSRIPLGFNADVFEWAWQAVIDRTPVLRTTFHWNDKPVQVVHRHVTVRIDRFDWRHTPSHQQSAHIEQYLSTIRREGFDFSAAPLMRMALIQVGNTETCFVWNFHHILLDGWSSQLLLKEIVDHYQAMTRGEAYQPPSRRPFSEYIAWLQGRDQAQLEAFWRQKLDGFSAPTAIGVGKIVATETPATNDGEFTLTLERNESELLRAFARQNRLTLNTLIQGAWALLLSRYSGETDILYGFVDSGRPAELPGVENMIGLFINSLPMRVKVSHDALLLPWLETIQNRQVEAAQYGYASTLQLQEWSGLPSRTKLFDTVLVFENFPEAFNLDTAGGTRSENLVDLGRADVAITVMIVPSKSVSLKFVFDKRRFDRETIQRLAGHFEELLRQMPAAHNAPLHNLSILSHQERHQTLTVWNTTAMPAYADQALMAQFTEQVQKTPDAVAFIVNDERVSFRSLDERSSNLAQYLIGQGVGPGSVVGVCLNRSIEAVISFLAVLKARGVYLPLDPSYPSERLGFMLADSRAALILTNGDAPPLLASRVIDLASVSASMQHCSSLCPTPHASPDDLAYILYTSGSTGQPKGVAVEHKVILNRLVWMWRTYPFEAGEIGVMRTPLNFVDSFWEMLGGLLQGVPTVISPDTVSREPDSFIELLAHHAVTRIWLVPSYLEMLLEACPDIGARLPRLRFWWSGGEPLSMNLYKRFRKAAPEAVLFNVYGASEIWDGTVFDPTIDEVGCVVPIGRPISNCQAYILDSQLQPLPVGVVGRLCIAGACLARCYVNQAELTRERFVPHPFDERLDTRLYDTGDLARFRADGVIEYVGRRDLQINLRGFRIEPAEIEEAINSHFSIRESVVVASELSCGDKQLVAYAVAMDDCRDTEALLDHLRQRLPPHMIPSAVVWLDALPKTPSGKRDRKKLPRPHEIRLDRKSAKPETWAPLESRVAGHFREILRLSKVGRNDNFFDLGGHSLLAMRLLSRLRDEFGTDLSLRTIFEAPTVARLAAELKSSDDARKTVDGADSVLIELEGLPDDEIESLLQSLHDEFDGEES
jgi:amino acid adenylation domain-containing protein